MYHLSCGGGGKRVEGKDEEWKGQDKGKGEEGDCGVGIIILNYK